ncbi:DUF6644 family protein [Caulobacter sp. RHG1]|uniref:DUF6644 family protein n=1 Tax=Caulobacter sp. (strain RHG1) TaxID=2545762 RepID=UPI00155778AC|nr:DUF6644 family protein [Caulobacter sp. RHG1]NQE61484.1 hypothetical protein [Caulobacter sp. RHG1]
MPDHFVNWLQGLPWSLYMQESLWAFPVLEAVHVLAVAVLFGSIAVVDIRLLGLASTRAPLTELSKDALKWTWGAFVVAAASGVAMLIPRLSDYLATPSLWLKFCFIAIAGINMAIFEGVVFRDVAAWDRGPPPRAARAAGLISLVCWTLVIVFGRWIGFTVGHGEVFGGGF